jgi:hypothetical protein
MKTNANTTARLESSTPAADFAQRVNLFDQVGLRTIKTTPLDNGYVVIETAAI